jgi:hypothetical protein
MSQLPLFSPKAEARRPPDPAFIRKHLLRVLRMARDAERLPWSDAETASWEKQFPDLVQHLPKEEGDDLLAEFQREISRLKKTAA